MTGCRPLKPDEVERLLSVSKTRPIEHLAILLPLTFGLRVSEVCNLRFGDARGGLLTIHSLKGSHNATMPIPSYIQNLLKEVEITYCSKGYATVPDDLPILHRLVPNGPRGNRYYTAYRHTRQWFHKILKKNFKKAGIEGGMLATNSLRKTFAKILLAKLNGDLMALQSYMRHVTIVSTIYYVESMKEYDLIESLPWVAGQDFPFEEDAEDD